MFYLRDIKNAVNLNDYSMGLDYYKANKVIKSSLKASGRFSSSLIGIVRGSGNNIYTQDIRVTKSTANGVEISGYCNCSIGYNCKHVVAACMDYIDKNNPKKEISPKEQWLEQFTKIVDTKQNKAIQIKNHNNDDFFLTYRFFSRSSRVQEEMLFYQSKFLASGQINKGSKLDSYRVFNGAFYELRDEQDDIIINLYFAIYQTNKHTSSYDVFKGELGYILIKKILETSKAYFDINNTPLKFSDDIIKPEFNFKAERGKYSLNVNKKTYYAFTLLYFMEQCVC